MCSQGYRCFLQVDRQGMQRNREVIKKLESSFEHNPIYFSRNIGLYYICFPDRVPSGLFQLIFPFKFLLIFIVPVDKFLNRFFSLFIKGFCVSSKICASHKIYNKKNETAFNILLYSQ